MDSEIKISYQLNQIVNTLSGRSGIRLSQLSRYPVCILYGTISEDIRQIFEMELVAQIGNEEAIQCIASGPTYDIRSGISGAIGKYREKFESRELPLIDEYYIPIIFMADQLHADTMKAFIRELKEQFVLMGFDDKYQIRYYCLFNYEYMDGKQCREQLALLQEDTEAGYPVGMFTQNYMFATETQIYIKVIQSIVMHIFLQVSQMDYRSSVLTSNNKEVSYFILGYWKLDILKQKLVDYLIHCIEKQNKDLEDRNYTINIQGIIDNILDIDLARWLDIFCRMPVRYELIQSIGSKGFFQCRRYHFSQGELVARLYGREDAFSEFIRLNLGNGNEQRFIEEFLQKDIGNLYAVNQELVTTLHKIKSQYVAEKNKVVTNEWNLLAELQIGRGQTIREILNLLRNAYWNAEGKIVLLDRKIEFIDEMVNYLDSAGFRKRIVEITERNQREINSLKVIRREAAMDSDRILMTADIKLNIPGAEHISRWEEDILQEDTLKNMADNMDAIKSQLQLWMNDNANLVIGDFIKKLQQMKANKLSDLYYTARTNLMLHEQEKEFLYIGLRYLNDKKSREKIEEMIKQELPNIRLFDRNWESDLCFELFVIREVNHLAEIYNFNERNRED